MKMASNFTHPNCAGVRLALAVLGLVLMPVLTVVFTSPGAGTSAVRARTELENVAAPTPIPLSSLIPPSLAETPPPPGSVSFCVRNPAQCRADQGSVISILLTPAHWRLIGKVNRDVNAGIQPMSDLEHYDRLEYWVLPLDGYGDCEDYALTKQKRLLDAGLPYSALRLAIVLTAHGKRHAVLTVTTSGGTMCSTTSSSQSWPGPIRDLRGSCARICSIQEPGACSKAART